MRRTALLLLLLAACAVRPERDEHVASTAQPFASAGSMLVDFELDLTLTADTVDPPKVRELIATQLMYLVGQLNGERSVGRHDLAELSMTTFGAVPSAPGTWSFAYHATIPVAWGGGMPPAVYTVTLPARVGEADQVAFAEKYAAACTDPEGGVTGAEDAGRMFLFYRPQRPGCRLARDDVVESTARVATSLANTTGKYPEYHRIWDDDALNVVTLFGRERGEERADDGGTQAYEAFVQSAETYARSIGSPQREDGQVPPAVRLAVDLPGGRKLRIDTALIPAHLSPERTSFDDWYDARTVDADLIVYSGHAWLGSNSRTLTRKGAFRARKYVVMAINGCDTLAYLDATLAERRALLNPDDPAGTKYMDTISNVLGGYFSSGAGTSLHLVRAFVSALDRTPQTYPELLSGIDPSQIAVVTGEEDNEFLPGMIPPAKSASAADAASASGPAPAPTVAPRDAKQEEKPEAKSRTGCAAAASASDDGRAAAVVAVGVLYFLRRRKRNAALS